MKKDIYFLLVTLLVAMLSLGLSSCSKDDDEGESASSKIVGTWHLVAHEDWSYNKGMLIGHEFIEYKKESATFKTRKYEVVNGKETGSYSDSNSSMYRLECSFDADGTFKFYLNNHDISAYGTYSVSNDSLKIIYEDSSTIHNNKCSFKGDQLVIMYEVYDGKNLKIREIVYFNKGAYPNT